MGWVRGLLHFTSGLTVCVTPLVPAVAVVLLLTGMHADVPLAAAVAGHLGAWGLLVLMVALAIAPWWALVAVLVRRDRERRGPMHQRRG